MKQYPDNNIQSTNDSNQAKLLKYLGTANIDEFWVKVGHSTFYKTMVKDDNLILRATQINYDLDLEGLNRSYTRSWTLTEITNGYEYLANYCLNNDGGAFFGCSDGHSPYPLKAEQKYSTQIITEIDDLPQNEQLNLYQWFSQVSGLILYLISSGGKSVHGHLLLNNKTPIEKVVYLRRLLCLALDGDPAVTRPHQPFRLPTFYRQEKGNYQEILKEGDSYTFDEILNGLKLVFSELGYNFPESIDDDWWSHLTSILNSDKNSKARKKKAVSKQEKLNKLKLALQQGQDYFHQQKEAKHKQRIAKAEKYQNYHHQLSNSEKEQFIIELLNHIPSKCPNDGLYEDYRSLYTALANELGKEKAISLANSHSPHKDWTQVINSSHGNFSLGTIIHYAQEWGNWKPSHQPNKEIIDPIHGKVILSGTEAISHAESSLTEEDIKQHQNITLDELITAVDTLEFTQFEEQIIIQFNQLSKKYRQGFNNQLIRIPPLDTKIITYNPDNFYLTSKEDFNRDKQVIIPRKYCDLHTKARVVNHLRIIGVKNVHLDWQTGEGKSQVASMLDRMLYLDTNYKNPSIPEITETPYLTPRTYYGTYIVNGELQADPDEKIRKKAREDNNPNIYQIAEGNCILKPAFRHLQDKGYNVEGSNLPCEKCPFQNNCSFAEGKFKKVTRDDIADMIGAGKGRMHPSQLTHLKLERLEGFGLAWEEAGRLDVTNNYYYSENDLKHFIYLLSKNSSIEINKKQQLINIFTYLIDLTNINEAKITGNIQGKYYGLNHSQILNDFPEIPEFNNNEYLQLYNCLYPNLDLELPDTNYQIKKLEWKDREWQSSKRMAERYMREELRQELFNKLDKISVNPILLLDAILNGNLEYILSTQKVETRNYQQWFITVTTPNKHYANVAKMAKFNLFLDATASSTQIRAMFELDGDGCLVEYSPLITVSTELNPLDNIKVLNIDVSGLGSNDWTEEGLRKAQEGIKIIKEENPKLNIAVMTLKRYAQELDTPFYYGKHDRGTNELMGYDAIIFVGTPFINVGAVSREYHVLFNGKDNKPTFEEFYNQKIYEIRVQEVGRLRGQHFKDKQLHQFFITSNENLSFLRELGLNYQAVDGAIISPELAKKGERTLLNIQTAIFNLFQAGVKPTCQAVGNLIGMTKQGVSKAIKEFEYGWKEFIKSQLLLYETYKGKVDNFPEEESWLHFLLEQNVNNAISICIEQIKETSLKEFISYLKELNTPYHTVCRLLWLISGYFDERLPDILSRFNLQGCKI